MDSVDTFDHIKVFSSPQYRFRRWSSFFFFTILLGMAEANGFIMKRRLAQLSHAPLPTHRAFRDQLALELLAFTEPTEPVPKMKKRASSVSARLPKLQSVQALPPLNGHSLYDTAEKREDGKTKRSRCKLCSQAGTETRVTSWCRQCGIPICDAHFVEHAQ